MSLINWNVLKCFVAILRRPTSHPSRHASGNRFLQRYARDGKRTFRADRGNQGLLWWYVSSKMLVLLCHGDENTKAKHDVMWHRSSGPYSFFIFCIQLNSGRSDWFVSLSGTADPQLFFERQTNAAILADSMSSGNEKVPGHHIELSRSRTLSSALPRRFWTPYICYSKARHKEMNQQALQGHKMSREVSPKALHHWMKP